MNDSALCPDLLRLPVKCGKCGEGQIRRPGHKSANLRTSLGLRVSPSPVPRPPLAKRETLQIDIASSDRPFQRLSASNNEKSQPVRYTLRYTCYIVIL